MILSTNRLPTYSKAHPNWLSHPDSFHPRRSFLDRDYTHKKKFKNNEEQELKKRKRVERTIRANHIILSLNVLQGTRTQSLDLHEWAPRKCASPCQQTESVERITALFRTTIPPSTLFIRNASTHSTSALEASVCYGPEPFSFFLPRRVGLLCYSWSS